VRHLYNLQHRRARSRKRNQMALSKSPRRLGDFDARPLSDLVDLPTPAARRKGVHQPQGGYIWVTIAPPAISESVAFAKNTLGMGDH